MLRLHCKCPPQTAHVKIKLVFGTLTCGKNTEKPFWIPLDDPFGSLWIPGKAGVWFFWAPGTHPGRKSPRLTKSHTATHRNSRMSGVSRHSGLSTNQSRSTLAFRSLRQFSGKKGTLQTAWGINNHDTLVCGRRGSLSHYSQGFIHPWWCRISSINSIMSFFNGVCVQMSRYEASVKKTCCFHSPACSWLLGLLIITMTMAVIFAMIMMVVALLNLVNLQAPNTHWVCLRKLDTHK